MNTESVAEPSCCCCCFLSNYVVGVLFVYFDYMLEFRFSINGIQSDLYTIACVASVSVRFRSKERGTRVKVRAKNGPSKRAGRGWGCVASVSVRFRNKERGTRVKDRAALAAKIENPVPRSFFAPKPNGNACYAGYVHSGKRDSRTKFASSELFFSLFYPNRKPTGLPI